MVPLYIRNAVVPDPPGYTSSANVADKKAKKHNAASISAPGDAGALELRKIAHANELKMKKAWELALSPAKSLPMQAIMLYMSGSGVQMFSMGIVWSLLTGPWIAIAGILRAFEPFKQLHSTSSPQVPGSSLVTVPPPPRYTLSLAFPMLLFVLCQCAVLGLGIYKCSTMGLVPMGTGDWLQFETREESPICSAVRSRSIG